MSISLLFSKLSLTFNKVHAMLSSNCEISNIYTVPRNEHYFGFVDRRINNAENIFNWFPRLLIYSNCHSWVISFEKKGIWIISHWIFTIDSNKRKRQTTITRKPTANMQQFNKVIHCLWDFASNINLFYCARCICIVYSYNCCSSFSSLQTKS